MNVKVLAGVLLLVVALPATTAYAAPADGTDALSAENDPIEQQATSTATAGGSSSGATAEEAAGEESDTRASDYTKLYVDTEHRNPEVKPGETATVNVTVQNAEDSAVTVDPHLFVPTVGGREQQLQEEWVTIDGETTIAAGEEQTFTVTVEVPEDASVGYYGGQIAFTDETVTYPGRPARPVHAANVNVEVWRQPTVTVVSNDYLRGQIEAGDSLTRQIVVKNEGDEPVPVNPQLEKQRTVRYGGSSSRVDPSWVDIDAPNRIAPGETGTITVTVSPPQRVDTGRYRGELDLGLKDPARRDGRNYWQRVSMHFEVWNQPEDAFETSFSVAEDAQDVSLTLSPRSGYLSGNADEQADFDVTFVSPSGERIAAERVQVTDRGSVDLSEQSQRDAVEQQGEYGVRNAGSEFVYRVDDPEAGAWSVEIVPENTIGFTYEIVRNETSDAAEQSP